MPSRSADNSFQCFLVEKAGEKIAARYATISRDQLPDGEVTIRIKYSSLNYKDGLAAKGHPGVALQLPLVPGIDAVGVVVHSDVPSVSTGQIVFVSAADFGTRHWGGWAKYARVPAEWCYPVPEPLTELETIALGTAGFTAAQSVEQLQRHGILPEAGPIVVSGATGGVGVFAVMLLNQLGYHVVASTGKPQRYDWLKRIGAREVISREVLDDTSARPLLSGRWAAGVDTVGGNTLATLLRSIRQGGCVTACGLVGGHQLELTVYPFILRGVCLQGIDSANVSRAECQRIWARLASDYKIKNIQAVIEQTSLSQIHLAVDRIMQGQISGRMIVDIGGA